MKQRKEPQDSANKKHRPETENGVFKSCNTKITKLTDISKNNITVDSFKIRISPDKFQIIDDSINSKHLLVNDLNGEIEGVKERVYAVENNGIKIQLWRSNNNEGRGDIQENLNILVTAKTLETDYLQGITANNIKQVYEYIISLNIVKFSLDTFLNSPITDIDFKFDAIIDIEANQLIDTLKSYTIAKSERDKGYRYYKDSKNKGIEWGIREKSKGIQAPYFKIYQKVKELEHRSFEFKEYYLKDQVIDPNTWRFELTVKNKQHFQSIFKTKENNNLLTALQISNNIKSNAMLKSLSKHLDIKKHIGNKINLEHVNMELQLFVNMIEWNININPNVNLNEMFNYHFQYIHNKKTLYNKRQKWDDAINIIKEQTPSKKLNTDVSIDLVRLLSEIFNIDVREI